MYSKQLPTIEIGGFRRFEKQSSGTLGVACGVLGEKKEEWFYKEEENFPAASLIKLPLLVVALKKVENGEISLFQRISVTERDKVDGAGILKELSSPLNLSLDDLITLMIVISDNTASNLVIDIVGGIEEVNKFLIKAGFNRTKMQRKFMIFKEGLENVTTPKEIYLFLKNLFLGNYLSSDLTKKAISLLLRQQYRDKIPLFLPSGIKVANKTGELPAGVRSDVAIIFSNPPFVLAVLTKGVKDPLKADRVIAKISRDTFNYVLKV